MALLSKHEAARAAGISEKTLDREVARGRLIPAGHERPATGGKLAPMFDPKDVARLRDARAQQQLLPAVLPDSTSGQTGVATRGGQGGLVRLLGEALQQQVPLSDKLTLSTDEAARLSGIPAGVLHKARHAGQLPAVKIGRGYRIFPDDLRAYVESLRPAAPKGKRAR